MACGPSLLGMRLIGREGWGASCRELWAYGADEAGIGGEGMAGRQDISAAGSDALERAVVRDTEGTEHTPQPFGKPA